MSSYINFNYDYSKQELLDLFNSSEKQPSDNSTRIMAVLGEQSYDLEAISPFFNKFSFIHKDDQSLALCQWMDKTKPHINARNNGVLIFPVSGSLKLNTYSYVTPNIDETGRPTIDFLNMTESEIEIIEATKIESVVVNSPIVINGLNTYSLEPNEPNTVTFVLKINTANNWESVLEFLQTM